MGYIPLYFFIMETTLKYWIYLKNAVHGKRRHDIQPNDTQHKGLIYDTQHTRHSA
jgi:hypothetical protein